MEEIIINRWTVLGLLSLSLIEIYGLFVSPWSWIYIATVLFLSLLLFVALFALGVAATAFRATVNDYVNDVDQMNWLFNPMYYAWLYQKDRRSFYRIETITCAVLSIILAMILYPLAVAAQNQTVALSSILTGGAGTLVPMAIFAVFFYRAVTTSSMGSGDNETPIGPAPQDEESEYKYD